MIDISPVIQFKMIDGKKHLLDLINGNTYEIDEFDDLKFILDLIDTLPNLEETIVDLMSNSYEKDYILHILKELKENNVLQPLSIVNPIKSKVQEWVDYGWSDALILHLSSRNLNYIDDPIELGGLGDLEYIPNFEKTNSENQFLKRIHLEAPELSISPNEILEAIQNRRSFQPFNKQSIDLNELSKIFWFSNQYNRELIVKSEKDRNDCFDSSFTALNSYLIVYAEVDSIQKGVYRYNKQEHSLDLIKVGDFKKEVAELAIGQRRASSGVFSIVITGDWDGYSQRYNHERSYRNLLINTSQLAQFYLVLGTHLDFNTFMTPAILDEKMYFFLELKDSYPLYITTFG